MTKEDFIKQNVNYFKLPRKKKKLLKKNYVIFSNTDFFDRFNIDSLDFLILRIPFKYKIKHKI